MHLSCFPSWAAPSRSLRSRSIPPFPGPYRMGLPLDPTSLVLRKLQNTFFWYLWIRTLLSGASYLWNASFWRPKTSKYLRKRSVYVSLVLNSLQDGFQRHNARPARLTAHLSLFQRDSYEAEAFVEDKIFPSQNNMELLLASASLVIAPRLFEALNSSTPPTITFFKSLPTDRNQIWAVYLLVLEKEGCRPKIYVGSGTNKSGVSARFSKYKRHKRLPVYVKAAMAHGYIVVQHGLLCWTPLPSAADAPVLLMVFIALKAAFTFVFWAVNTKREYGSCLVDLCQWARDTLEYDGLCSHNALQELPTGDLTLSAEELEAKATQHLE